MTAIALLAFTACNNTQKPTDNAKPGESPESQPIVDWDTPLYELSAEGDTTCVWTYLESEKGRTVIQLSEQEDSFYDRYEYQYDPDGKLISKKTKNYTYEGNVRTMKATPYSAEIKTYTRSINKHITP